MFCGVLSFIAEMECVFFDACLIALGVCSGLYYFGLGYVAYRKYIMHEEEKNE